MLEQQQLGRQADDSNENEREDELPQRERAHVTLLHLWLTAPPAGQLESPSRFRFISKNRTGSFPAIIWSPTSGPGLRRSGHGPSGHRRHNQQQLEPQSDHGCFLIKKVGVQPILARAQARCDSCPPREVSRGFYGGLTLPILLCAAVVLGGLARVSSLRDAVTGAPAAGVGLELPVLYVVLSPVSRILDAIGLLSTGQHIAFATAVVGASVLVGAARDRRAGPRGVRRILTPAAIALVALLVVYACVAALPRPMARLVAGGKDLVRVDFHSHTNASPDTRRGFSPERNRAWHRAGGFDAAYISDHRSFIGAEAGQARNPARAGDGTVLLSAYEGRYRGTFEIFLSLTRADSVSLMDRRRHLREGTLRSGRVPSSVVVLPSPLVDVQAEARDGPPHIVAIEVSDGSPRGLAQSDRDRETIIRRADSLGIALVSGSNNHGWGRVVPAWTLVAVRDWRKLPPDSLGAAIEDAVRTSPGTAVRVVERRRPTFASPAALALTAPVAAGQMFRTLTIPERLVWLVWIWGAWIVLPRLWSRSGPRDRPDQ